MINWLFKMMLGVSPEKAEKEIKEEQRKDIIHPFPDAPVKIDFFRGRLLGRRTPEYVAVPYGRMFTCGEEKILTKAMLDACVAFYGERMDKKTLSGFRNFVLRECKVAGPQENHDAPSPYSTPQKQLESINDYVEDSISRRIFRETPFDRYYDAYRDVQAIHKITMIHESRKAVEMAEEEEKRRHEEYQKYKNIWY